MKILRNWLGMQSNMTERRLVVGLGNPGREYSKNRHNAGFQALDSFSQRAGLTFSRQQAFSLIGSGVVAETSIIVAKPQTYMNRSGVAVQALLRFYKLSADQLLVIYDDLDLPVGTIRLKPSGGAGGQNGVKSIVQHLGTQEFPRLRIGIGRPPGKMASADYVLQDFARHEQEIMENVYQHTADAIETWISHGIELAMSRHNGPSTNLSLVTPSQE